MAAGWQSMHVGDFNADGYDDVAGFRSDGTWWVGTSTRFAFRLGRWAQWPAGFNTLGQWQVALAGSGRFLGRQNWDHWDAASQWRFVAVGDFDGDGRADLLASNALGEWWVALSASKGFLLHRWYNAGTATFSAATARVGDFTGDRRDDVVLFGPDGGKALWQGFSTGAAFRVKKDITSEQAPYRSGAPWHPSNAKAPVDRLPLSLRRRLTYNNANALVPFEQYFRGTLRSWLREADAGSLDDAAMLDFIRSRLNAHFLLVRNVLAQRYLGLDDPQYRLLMTMNLVHGHLDYETRSYIDNDFQGLLRLSSGDCSEFATLTAALCKLQGFDSKVASWVSNYRSPTGGLIFGIHAVTYVNCMMLDALANLGIQVNLDAISAVPPAQRLPRLLDQGLVYGFYNWFAKPEIRQIHLARGYDAAVIPLYYFYYFEGIGQGKSTLGAYAI